MDVLDKLRLLELLGTIVSAIERNCPVEESTPKIDIVELLFVPERSVTSANRGTLETEV